MTAKTINIQPNECYGSTTDILQYELYDRVEIEKQKCTKEQNKKCVSDTSPSTLTSTVTAVGRSKKKAKRKAATVMIGLLVFFSLLLGSLLAMILYSPLVRKYWENSTDFSLKIQQLEDQLEVLKQENNKTQEVLNSHATNLYQNCIQDRRSCTMQSGDGSYYWEGCYTEPQLSINQANNQYYTVAMWCEYTSPSLAGWYFESTTIVKDGNNYRCYCDVTSPGSQSATHTVLPASFSATCTLIVTKCPRSVNLQT